MYKHLSRPGRRNDRRATKFSTPSALAGLLFFALSIVAPAQIQKAETRVFSTGLKVSIERSSPAFAALEDDLYNSAPPEAIMPKKSLGRISSGESFSAYAQRIAADNQREAQVALQKQMAQSSQHRVVEISREELLQSLFLPLVIASKTAPQVQTKMPAHSNDNGKYEVNQAAIAPPKPLPDSLKPDTSIDPDQPHLVRGLLELTNGLALTSPSDELTVFQEVEGEQWQRGTVWIREGRYAIEVPNREGLLVAELRTERGELLGRGELELVHLPVKKKNQFKVSDVTIRLYPISSTLEGRILSAYSHNDVKKAVRDAQIEIMGVGHRVNSERDGHFEDSQILEGSSVIVQVQRAGYWGTLAVGSSKSRNEFTLYPNKMLKAFMSFAYANDPTLKLDQDTALVWGKITRNGKPIAGAHVELMTTEKPLTPIYFNELMIPDPKLKATTANGLYAFLPVPSGAHAVQVTDQGILSEPIVFPADARHVSTIDIETMSWKRMVVKSFDAFAPETQVAADLYRLGFDSEKKRSAGVAELKYVASTSLLVLNSVPSSADYAPARISVTRQSSFAYLPMIKTKWLKGLIAGRRTPGTSIAVGFVNSKKTYRVHPDVGSAASVIYFDPQGKEVEGNLGVPGGGYVVLNLDPGFKTISVVPLGTDSVSAQTILADSKFVNLINHVIR